MAKEKETKKYDIDLELVSSEDGEEYALQGNFRGDNMRASTTRIVIEGLCGIAKCVIFGKDDDDKKEDDKK